MRSKSSPSTSARRRIASVGPAIRTSCMSRDLLGCRDRPLPADRPRRSQQDAELVEPRHARVLDRAALAQRARQARERGRAAGELDRRSGGAAGSCAAPSSQRRPRRSGARLGQAAHRAPDAVARDVEARARERAWSSRRGGGRPVRLGRAARGSRRARRGRRGRRPRSRGRSAPRSRRARRRRRAGRRARRRGRRRPRTARRAGPTAAGRAGACRRSRPGRTGRPRSRSGPFDALDEHAAERPRPAPCAAPRSRRASQSGAGVASEFRTQTHGALRRRDAAVGAAGEAVVAAELEHANAGMMRAQQRDRAVARAVVGDEHLRGCERLRAQRGEAVGQQPLAVEVDDDDRDGHRSASMSNFPCIPCTIRQTSAAPEAWAAV